MRATATTATTTLPLTHLESILTQAERRAVVAGTLQPFAGRLVDNAADVSIAIEAYEATGGVVTPNSSLVTGYDFVGDAYNADPASPDYNPVPTPDDNPDDCAGHGSHVAGIVGANGTVRGVAPDVTFGAYRVFGCAGSTEGDIMIAAMERALADGMQVVNQSIGSSFQWPEYPTAKAADRLVKAGVPRARIATGGYGAERLLDQSGTAEAHERNTRLEFVLRE